MFCTSVNVQMDCDAKLKTKTKTVQKKEVNHVSTKMGWKQVIFGRGQEEQIIVTALATAANRRSSD